MVCPIPQGDHKKKSGVWPVLHGSNVAHIKLKSRSNILEQYDKEIKIL